ncbi:MAG TPA: cytochrome c oxidase subunit I [Gammaproteobacteria bacterium]|nr:cytochrome c oxidase subunit I [Gammaproteobacteria bacterium]
MSAHAPARSYLHTGFDVASWLATTDHKRIAWLYVGAITLFFVIGGVAATLIRVELATPNGDVVTAETYNRLFSLHGIVMVWFFLVPAVPVTLGNFLVPLMIGARDLAFPRLNLASWYLFMAGAVFTVAMMLAGGVDTGWTFYTPLSSTFSNSHVVAAIVGVLVAGFSTILTGLNFVVTVHTLRAAGMTWRKLPLFVWSIYATSIIMLLATPVLAVTLLLVAAERAFHIGIFDPALGGDPLLFQHLFWFYSHPAVYIMILPGMGIVSEIVACYARRRIFGYKFMAGSILAIAFVGFLVWGHHMFVSGQSPFAGLMFGLLSFIVAVPSAIKVFNWVMTLRHGSISLDAPMLYAIGFIGLFTTGGLTGLFLASLAVDVHVHDTYFVVAHFHYIMVGGMVMAYIGGLHFWWPKLTGRLYHEGWARLSAVLGFFGFNLTFFPLFIAGYLGMPRRYHEYPPEYQILQVLATAGALVLAFAYAVPLVNLGWSMLYGKKAPANPWRAQGLEWTVASPPPTENFARPVAVVGEPYDYDPTEAADGASSRG